ncbi:hypothetical protein N9Y60_04455 [Crocinitomicaceae bacterium]|nr:hypothetical protein [Crocinitomicaceae bacterium]
MRAVSFLTLFLAITLLSGGCTSNYPLKSVNYDDLFCDGNSKVWVINKMIVNDIDVSQSNLTNKEVFIFHESGVLDYVPLKVLGSASPKKGRYYLDSDKRTLSIVFHDKEWFFMLSVLEDDRIVMRPYKKGRAPFTLELIPLPEL